MNAISRDKGLKRRRRNHEIQFLAPAIEILEAPAGPMPWISAWVLVVIAALALLWSTIGRVDIMATAPGRIIPTDKVKPVQPASGGRVARYHVRDGDIVRGGDTLVELDTNEHLIELEKAQGDLRSLRSDVKRLNAALELGTRDVSTFLQSPAADGLLPEHQALLSSIVAHQAARLKRLRAQLDETDANVAASTEQIMRSTAILPLIVERLENISQLVDRQIVARPLLLELRQKRIETESDIRMQQNRIEQLAQTSIQLREQIQETMLEYSKSLLTELNTARAQIRVSEQAVANLHRKISESRIAAPVDGVVYQSQINAINSVVQPAQVIMQIVPADESLIMEAALDSKDVGFVEVGQRAEVKLDAYPFTQYGLLEGRVTAVSADSVLTQTQPTDPSSKPSGEDTQRRPIYAVRISLSPAKGVFKNGVPYELKPGMSGSVDIRTGDRRLIQYIFSPLQTTLRNAGGER